MRHLPDSLAPDSLAHQLRAAVLGTDYAAALRLVDEYTEALREYWTSLAPGERAVSGVPQQSLELMKWVREMTLMQRAMTGEHLKMVEKSMRYQTARMQYLQSARIEPRSA
jgi:hypothetical protein